MTDAPPEASPLQFTSKKRPGGEAPKRTQMFAGLFNKKSKPTKRQPTGIQMVALNTNTAVGLTATVVLVSRPPSLLQSVLRSISSDARVRVDKTP